MISLLKLLAACSLISMDLPSLTAVEVGTVPLPVTATAGLPGWMATIHAELLQSTDQVTLHFDSKDHFPRVVAIMDRIVKQANVSGPNT